MQILISNSKAGPGRTVKQEQEEISRNHVQAFIPGSVQSLAAGKLARLMRQPSLESFPKSPKPSPPLLSFLSEPGEGRQRVGEDEEEEGEGDIL